MRWTLFKRFYRDFSGFRRRLRRLETYATCNCQSIVKVALSAHSYILRPRVFSEHYRANHLSRGD